MSKPTNEMLFFTSVITSNQFFRVKMNSLCLLYNPQQHSTSRSNFALRDIFTDVNQDATNSLDVKTTLYCERQHRATLTQQEDREQRNALSPGIYGYVTCLHGTVYSSFGIAGVRMSDSCPLFDLTWKLLAMTSQDYFLLYWRMLELWLNNAEEGRAWARFFFTTFKAKKNTVMTDHFANTWIHICYSSLRRKVMTPKNEQIQC